MENELDPRFVRQGLGTRYVGQHIYFFPILTSTMDAARKAVGDGAAEGAIVLAGEQTEGRGRLKRAWISPRGCLACSLILYPEERYLFGLVMVATIAVAETVTEFTPIAAGIKWPNDVLVNGKKISGILIETGPHVNKRDYAVVGIGLNVNLEPATCPEIGTTATSLSAEVGRELSRVVVLRTLLTKFERWYEALLNEEPVFEAWRAKLVTLGKEVQVRAGGVLYEGLAEDVTRDGVLLLRSRDGSVVKMPAGDVTLKHPSLIASTPPKMLYTEGAEE